ncbi:MAG TPA: hypothetical protein VIL77_06415 [Gaiellaceae bacterium]
MGRELVIESIDRARALCAVVIASGERHWPIFRHLRERANTRGSSVPNAYLAALNFERPA